MDFLDLTVPAEQVQGYMKVSHSLSHPGGAAAGIHPDDTTHTDRSMVDRFMMMPVGVLQAEDA
jgi:hypothetical protein